MNKISKEVDQWILEMDMPFQGYLKPIRKFDGLYPEDPEEYEAYWDFIQWAMSREHEVLLAIPKKTEENDFWKRDVDEFGNDVSAFNTVDYKRMHPERFDKYQYMLKKTFEKVKDYAETYSCITNKKGKENIHERYMALVDRKFRDNAEVLLLRFNSSYGGDNAWISDKINEASKNIRICEQIWKEFSEVI